MQKFLVALAGVAAALLTGQAAFASGHMLGGAVGAAVAPKHYPVAGRRGRCRGR
jgi:hypothetical protein